METKNLIIRETEFNDCEYFTKWETDPDVIQYLSYDEDRTYEDVVEEWILDRQDPTKLQYTIVKKDIAEPIGRIYITRLNHDADSLDITKLYIGEEQQRKAGLGEEVLIELLKHCFIFLHMERVTLDYYTGNNAAAHLYDKVGFQREGVARNGTKKNGKYYDLHLMSMLRSEFFEKVHDR